MLPRLADCFIAQKTVRQKGCVQIVISHGRPRPFLKVKSVGCDYFKPGRFAEKQCDLHAMAVYQMHFAVTAEHRCTDTGADAFHYLVVLMCCSRPDPSTGYKTGAEYDNPQCQQDMIFSRHADDDADSRTCDSGQQSE